MFNVEANTETWVVIRAAIIERDNFACQRCGKSENLHVHHIIPRISGGTDEPDNLITLCQECHVPIGTKIIEREAITGGCEFYGAPPEYYYPEVPMGYNPLYAEIILAAWRYFHRWNWDFAYFAENWMCDENELRDMMGFIIAPKIKIIGTLADVFSLSQDKSLGTRARYLALTLELHAAAERTAELLGRLAELAVADPPEL